MGFAYRKFIVNDDDTLTEPAPIQGGGALVGRET